MEILAAFVGKVVELAVQPIAQPFGYMFYCRRNVKELKDQVTNLKAKRESVQHSVDDARRNCEAIEDVVRDWMRRVDEMTEQAERFYEKESHASTECSQRSCPNLLLRHQLSKKAKKMAAEVDRLKAKGNFEKISFQTLPQSVGQSSEVGKAFESRISIMNQIMEALADHAVHAIGLYGTGGVGKTTLAKQVVKKAQEEKLFDTVVLVEVKHNSLKEIQSQIADMLGLKFDMQSESELPRASRLRQRLEQEKNLLLVLDDLWERLDLDQVGIPFTSEGNDGFKVLLTSRSADLLSSQMNCTKNIMVGLLSEEEAWGLFKEMAKINDDSNDPDFLSIAAEVSQKCAQLPLAIVAVARVLRNKKSLVEWKDALRRLKSPTSRNITGIKEVDSSLKLSYDYLESEELKSTFLLSAMFSQDPSIADLFIYAVGLGLLQELHNMQEARDRLYALVYKLKASSLLLDSRFKDHFTMHDVVRDLALSIAFEEQHALVLRDKKVDEWPYEDQLESCTAMCLYNSSISKFPEELYAPKAKFFLLNSNDRDLRIPSGFFKEMQELKVLNLTNLTFSSLPSSISLLKKLVTLSLQSCTLEDITVVEHLKKLKVLNLSSSRIKQLPCEVGQLSCLQMLNLSNCGQLKVIPPNVLSSLKRLEELYMRRSFNQWKENQGKEMASLEELKHLQKLSALEIDILDVTVLPMDLFLKNSLERYDISIGTTGGYDSNYEFSRKLTLKLNTNIGLKGGVFRLLESVEDLYLENLNGITSLCELQTTARTFCKLKAIKVSHCHQLKSLFLSSNTEIISKLEEIEVSECNSLEEIVTIVDKENIEKGSIMSAIKFLQLRSLKLNRLAALTDLCFTNMVFPKLETFTLSGKQAKMMWNGKFRAYHFLNVKFLYLSEIYDRAATFPCGLFYGFPNLKVLDVSCSSIEVILSSSGPLPDDALTVAPFTKLNLQFMNRLKHIWNEKCQLIAILHNLETLQVFHCQALINLGPSFVSLANLTDLVISGCDGLINLLTSCTARTLVQLTRLSITACKKIEEVITNGEEDVETEIVFMKLKMLKLTHLDNCKSFCLHNYTFEFPSLDEVIINGCPGFKMFCPGSLTTPLLNSVKMEKKIYWQSNLNKTIQQLFDDKVSLFHNTSVKIDEYPELIDIWNGKFATPDCWISNLTYLVVDKCGFLSTHVIPSHVLISLVNLQRLQVSNCDSVEVVFDLEGIDLDEDAHSLQSIPLWTLTLEHLPKLKYVWNKAPHTFACFQQLHELDAKEFESLTSIIPTSIATGLSELRRLWVESCGVEVIVAEDHTTPLNVHFVFPELYYVGLRKLPNLKNFCLQRHTIDWPKLIGMDVRQCKKLKVFGWEVSKKTEKDTEDEVQNQYPLFSSEKVILKLNDLVLNQNDIQMLSNGEFQDDLFHNVRHLTLDSSEQEPLPFPYTFLERFPSLRMLTVGHSSFKEIFPSRSSCSDPPRKVPQFTSLALTHLEQLQSIWNEDSQTNPLLQILECLAVSHCSKLINLAPSSSSFNNLKELGVTSCHSLSHLLTAATTRSLVCLETLQLLDCEMMEEIVTDEGEHVEDKIVLKRLIYMRLVDLPILKSFCSQTCAFEFPSLKYVTIEGCPKMKMFCEGVVVTPLLEVVKIEENEERWEENINKTVESLFSEKVCTNCSSSQSDKEFLYIRT